MKTWQKVLLGVVTLSLLSGSKKQRTDTCIRVSNMEFPKIPNNGGL